MRKPITREEAETFFRFFYIATSNAPFYKGDCDSRWEDIDPTFREMRDTFFDGDLPYNGSEVHRELDVNANTSLNMSMITTTAYGEWFREKIAVPNGGSNE